MRRGVDWAATDEPIEPRPADAGELPLSLAQERIWFLAQLDPEDASYNLFLVYRLRGELATGALERALHAIVARHEVLRTRFVAGAGGRPVQLVEPAWRPDLERIDLTGLPAGEREPRALDLVAARANLPFDLAARPALRTSLLRLDARDHVLCIVLHYLVADGWSVGVLWHELAVAYEAGRAGAAPDLPPLPVQYADYALWQRRRLAGAAQEDLDYWRGMLADAPALELPAGRPPPAVRTSAGAAVIREVQGEVAAAVERLARSERCTLFMALLAAFQAVLAARSGQDDVSVGFPAAGRDEVELEPMIGLFLNTLVHRGDLAGDPTFRELLARTRTRALEAYGHQEIPFERLLTELGARRSGSAAPLFQAMFSLENPDAAGPSLAGLEVEAFEAGYRHAKVDLALEVWRDPRQMTCIFEYRTDLLDEETVGRLAADFEAVLVAAAADPDARLSTLPVPVLEPEERGRVLVEWNQTSTGGAGDGDLVELFESQVRRQPDAVAVSAAGDELRYAELNQRANRLARALRRRGVGAEARVAVCAERSPELVVALLAVLKAGGAYVPLDPALPDERLAGMLRDSGAILLVTQERLLGRLPAGGPPALCLDRECPEDDADLPRVATAGCLAYVIYTSGSTGGPKGVLVERGALLSRVRWMRDRYQLCELDRVLQLASIGFDTHAEEVYPCLLAGATLVLGPPGGELADYLAAGQGRWLTVLDLATPQWHELVRDLRGLPWPPGLRLLILGADQVQPRALAAWREAFGDRVRVVNTYGPTEATIVATAADLELDDPWPRPPIGRPIADTRAYVLNGGMEPVPVGVPGELCLAGAGLARGYLGRPGLTAARFVPDPHGPPGSRLYRTGDRARHRPDGQLEFLGRLDDQVKVRGHRVEPGEVEAALLEHPRVLQAAVLAREDGVGDRSLVAYVVSVPGAEPTTSELRRHLARRLPAPMVPSAFVDLERLPLTAAGKVDRRALPEPEGRPALEHAYLAPRTAAEELVAATWADVLGQERVGALDDFFELGGHSLLATRVVAALRDAAGVEVPLRAVFSAGTVAALAAAVEALLVAEIDQLTDEEAERLLQR